MFKCEVEVCCDVGFWIGECVVEVEEDCGSFECYVLRLVRLLVVGNCKGVYVGWFCVLDY